MARKKKTPQIVVDIDDELAVITVKIRGAERINARLLGRVSRMISRTRRLELKKFINATKLKKDDFEKKYGKGEKDDGRGKTSSERSSDEGDRGDADEIRRLANQIDGKL